MTTKTTKKKKQNRAKFSAGELQRIQSLIQSQEGHGPRAQQSVRDRMTALEADIRDASPLQRFQIRKRLGIA